MSECDSSTEETVNSIIAQCKYKALQFKSRQKSHNKSRQNMNPKELEIIRKRDNERKNQRRRKMSEAEYKQFLIRENDRKRQRRLKKDFDKIRAKEAARKRKMRKNMPTDKLKAFRAKDAERKRLARLKKKTQESLGDQKLLVKLNSAKESLSSSRSANRSTLCDSNENTVKRKRGRPPKNSNSDESCDFEKMIHYYDSDDRVKDLEAVLNDLLEEQDVTEIPENIISCDLSTENRMKELEEKIWELIDEQEMAEQVNKNTKVQNDTAITIVDSSDEFSELDNEILNILQKRWDDSEIDTKN